jgi:hypothetical protein
MDRNMTLPWWTGLSAAGATISCGGENHRLSWDRGILTAPDHGDPTGERTLMALGGEPLACIEMLDVWERHATDPNVLLFGSRGAVDLITRPAEMSHQPRPTARPAMTTARGGRGGATRATLSFSATHSAANSESVDDDEAQLAQLLSLGGGIGQRLNATVAAYWRDRLRTPDAETDQLGARLHAALYGRVLATLSTWLGQTDIELALDVLPEHEMPSLRRTDEGGVAAALPFSWLVEVWARGLETVWGTFCLSATSLDGQQWDVRTIDSQFDQPNSLKILLPNEPERSA